MRADGAWKTAGSSLPQTTYRPASSPLVARSIVRGIAWMLVAAVAFVASAQADGDTQGTSAGQAAGAPADPARAEREPAPGCEPGLGERAARTIQARYEGIRDISARFEQTNESATFGGTAMMSPEPKTGRVVFAKPGKMRWTYLEPEPSVVVSDGQTLWIHDIEGETVTRLEVTAGFLSGAALQFLLGDGQILESFTVRALACDAEQITLDLVPKQESTYERLGLVATRARGDIVGTSVLDLFGNLTVIRFDEIQTNQRPDDSTFELVVPEGVELIDYAGSQGS